MLSFYCRLTSIDNYFLSDGLYVSADQLLNTKALYLNVCLVNPTKAADNWEDGEGLPSKWLKLTVDSAGDATATSSSKDTGAVVSPCTGTQPEGSEKNVPAQEKPTSLEASSASCSFGTHTCQTTELVKDVLQALQKGDTYVLDIDLDFFSVKNPFKEIYTQVISELWLVNCLD